MANLPSPHGRAPRCASPRCVLSRRPRCSSSASGLSRRGTRAIASSTGSPSEENATRSAYRPAASAASPSYKRGARQRGDDLGPSPVSVTEAADKVREAALLGQHIEDERHRRARVLAPEVRAPQGRGRLVCGLVTARQHLHEAPCGIAEIRVSAATPRATINASGAYLRPRASRHAHPDRATRRCCAARPRATSSRSRLAAPRPGARRRRRGAARLRPRRRAVAS